MLSKFSCYSISKSFCCPVSVKLSRRLFRTSAPLLPPSSASSSGSSYCSGGIISSSRSSSYNSNGFLSVPNKSTAGAYVDVHLKQKQKQKQQHCAYIHNWKNNMDIENKKRKVIPKLVYLHNPWKYLVTKFNLLKLQLFWDREFHEREFIRGSKKAAVVLTDIIRTQNTSKISQFTTPIGFQQITRDMVLSRNDSRLKLVKFDTEHLRRAIPMKVATRKNYGRKYCFIDMLFVGLRNTKDFNTPEEVVEVNNVLRKLDSDLKTPFEVLSVPHRIVFAEIFMRFRRDYTEKSLSIEKMKNNKNTNSANSISNQFLKGPADSNDWSVSFYKILTFDVLNYDPKT